MQSFSELKVSWMSEQAFLTQFSLSEKEMMEKELGVELEGTAIGTEDEDSKHNKKRERSHSHHHHKKQGGLDANGSDKGMDQGPTKKAKTSKKKSVTAATMTEGEEETPTKVKKSSKKKPFSYPCCIASTPSSGRIFRNQREAITWQRQHPESEIKSKKWVT